MLGRRCSMLDLSFMSFKNKITRAERFEELLELFVVHKYCINVNNMKVKLVPKNWKHPLTNCCDQFLELQIF